MEAGRAAASSGHAAAVVVHAAAEGPAYRSLVRTTGDPGPLAEILHPAAQVGLYRTATRDCRRHRVGWQSGEPTPGVGMIFGVRRAPGLTPAQFHDHWATTHRPLALRHHTGMWDYRQVSVAEHITDGSPHYDGFAIVQFPNLADMETRFFDGDEGKRVIRDDAARFTDARRSDMVLMAEHVLLEPPPPPGPSWLTDYRRADVAAPANRVWGLIGRPQPGEQDRESRPGELMLVRETVAGLPAGIEQYRCRYEVRETGAGRCRLDWQPTALVDGGSVSAFDAVVAAGWAEASSTLASGIAPASGE